MWASGPHRRQLYQTCARGARIMRVHYRPFAILACSFLLAVFSPAQAVPPVTTKTAPEEKGFTWTETYEGSGNTDGFITDINSTVGYIFDGHFSMDMGVPYLFVRPSSSQTGTTSVAGMGNPYVGLRYSRKGPSLDFSTSLNGAVPAASSAKGLGSELDLGDKFSVSASGYYILPWGPKQIFLRGTKSSSGPTKGAVSLTRDDGINLGIDYNLTRSLDLSAGYS